MNVVDSCGWLKYLADGLNAAFFEPALIDLAGRLCADRAAVLWTQDANLRVKPPAGNPRSAAARPARRG